MPHKIPPPHKAAFTGRVLFTRVEHISKNS
jgi:hypothetical protein